MSRNLPLDSFCPQSSALLKCGGALLYNQYKLKLCKSPYLLNLANILICGLGNFQGNYPL